MKIYTINLNEKEIEDFRKVYKNISFSLFIRLCIQRCLHDRDFFNSIMGF